jgi:uncharacterized membrane protein
MHSFPPELVIFLASMFPLGELRTAIPLGIFLGMQPFWSFFWGELGDLLAVMVVLYLLGPVSQWLMKHSKLCHRTFTKIFNHTRNKHSIRLKKMGTFFLVLLTALPIPGTGGYTGALLAFTFDLPYWQSIALILAGNIIAGILVMIGAGSVMELIKIFFK